MAWNSVHVLGGVKLILPAGQVVLPRDWSWAVWRRQSAPAAGVFLLAVLIVVLCVLLDLVAIAVVDANQETVIHQLQLGEELQTTRRWSKR